MRRAWILLAVSVLAAGGVLIAMRRAPRPGPAPPPPAAARPFAHLTVRVVEGGLDPAWAEVPLGSQLVLTRASAAPGRHVLSLAGYEHALAPCTLLAGASRTDTLFLDLPGEDFAWLLDHQPVGRLAVAGSHLVEGHR